MDLHAGLGVAVRSTAAGLVDYALFIGAELCGAIEAKPGDPGPAGFAEQTASADTAQHPVQREVRFAYAVTGSETLLRDGADPAPRWRHVFAFHRPQTLQRWLADDVTIRRRLRAMPPLITESLRDCQIDAVRALEASLAADKHRALIQMAPGAGKTFTACTLSHRLLEHGKFHRILFLADRAHLVRQARDDFFAYHPPGAGRSITELFDIQTLGPAGIEESATIVISTLERVYAMLTKRDLSEDEEERSAFELRAYGVEHVVSYNPAIPIETFDLIIIDECHPSIYSTSRQVLAYFDAFIVGLTSARSLQTLGFFGNNLVAQYPCRRSVADGVTVDHEVYRVRAEIGAQAGEAAKAHEQAMRERRTCAQELSGDSGDAVAHEGSAVTAPKEIRTVVQAFRDSLFDLFPGRTEVPKTLIFAKDDDHAEDIVDIVREAFGGNDIADKIAYRQHGVDPEQLIRRFRTDHKPRIAVTADMIATGTDLRPLEALIFLRDVKSALYFEQMMGRGARTINPAALRQVTPDAEAKTRFIVIDAVGVAERFDHHELHRLRKDAKRHGEIRAQEAATDAVVSYGDHDETSARDAVEKFETFLEVNRNRLAALQVLHGRARPGQKLDRAALEELRGILWRPPWLLEPVDIWRAYVRLDGDRVKGNPAGTLSDVVMLLRYGVGASSTLKPLSPVAASRFNLWLLQQERAGRVYSEAQKAWLRAIRDHIAANAVIAPQDLMEAPDFSALGRLDRAYALFGAQLQPLLEELPQVLVA
jgi:type I restriction enzyme, R subunit